MSFYVAAYDTEAIYPWWELGDEPYSAQLYKKSVSYTGTRLRECLNGIQAVAQVHQEHRVPATFFIVAKLVEHARSELRSILDDPLFDIQCHSYTHENLVEISNNDQALRHELVDSKNLIEDAFGKPVTGLTTPGGFSIGLAGRPLVLRIMWESGYRFVRSVAKGEQDSVPAPLNQPFWYTSEGYENLLEIPTQAWHDNILTGQPFLAKWPPVLPWGYPSRVATTAAEVYQAYAPGIDYVVEQNLLTYTPTFHPWSIYRIDQRARQIDMLLTQARKKLTVVSCIQLYQHIVDRRSLASEKMESIGI